MGKRPLYLSEAWKWDDCGGQELDRPPSATTARWGGGLLQSTGLLDTMWSTLKGREIIGQLHSTKCHAHYLTTLPITCVRRWTRSGVWQQQRTPCWCRYEINTNLWNHKNRKLSRHPFHFLFHPCAHKKIVFLGAEFSASANYILQKTRWFVLTTVSLKKIHKLKSGNGSISPNL